MLHRLILSSYDDDSINYMHWSGNTLSNDISIKRTSDVCMKLLSSCLEIESVIRFVMTDPTNKLESS